MMRRGRWLGWFARVAVGWVDKGAQRSIDALVTTSETKGVLVSVDKGPEEGRFAARVVLRCGEGEAIISRTPAGFTCQLPLQENPCTPTNFGAIAVSLVHSGDTALADIGRRLGS